MSITLTIYDIFGTIVPGLIYLYIINETLIAFHQKSIDTTQLTQLPNQILVVVAAFVLGHLFNEPSYRWFRFFVRKYGDSIGLMNTRELLSFLPIQFRNQDARILISLIRHLSPERSREIELFRANTIMLRSISLGLALFALLQIGILIQNGIQLNHMILAVLALLFSAMALFRARLYDTWFYREVFTEALNYGNSLEEVLFTTRRLTAKSTSNSNPSHNSLRESRFE